MNTNVAGGGRVACVAVISKQNSPLYIQTIGQEDELKFHFIVHTSLDVVEEKLATKEKQNNVESFLGLLFPTEDWNVYGHVSSTGTKFIVILDDLNMDANRIKVFLRDLSFVYCDVVCNPFYELGTPITSGKFREKVNALLNILAK